MPNNKKVLRRAIQQRKKQLLKKVVDRSNDNWEKRLAKYFTGNVVIRSNVSSDGSKGFSELQYPWIGVQNAGYEVDARTPVRAPVMVFTVGGRSTLIIGSLDSQRPIEGNVTVFTKFAKRFKKEAGRWDLANKLDLLEYINNL